MSLKNAITDKFQFSIKNNGDRAVRVALATGLIDVEGIDLVTDDKDENLSAVRHFHNVENLLAEGYQVDTVLDDASVELDNRSVVMATVDASKSIRHAKHSLSRNFRWIKKVTIAATSTAAYQTSMSIATLSPFHKENERDIDLNDFFSVQQFQNDKIVMNFAHGEFQWNDELFWALNVPAGVTEQISIEFYD